MNKKTKSENLFSCCAHDSDCREEWIKVSNNVSLRVITFKPRNENSNPPIILVAGWITQIEAWQKALREMTKEFTVHYVETREKSSSRITGKAEYSVEAIGRDVVQLISHFHLQNRSYILFGSSLGATAILDCCRSLLVDPLCLVLINPNAVFRAPKLGMVVVRIFWPRLYLILKPFIKWYLKNFRLDTQSDCAQYEKYCRNLDAADPWKLKKAMIALSKYQVWNLLPDIRFPTLIVGGSKDKLHEPQNLQKMVSMMKNAKYVDMETNERTHSEKMVEEMRKYISEL